MAKMFVSGRITDSGSDSEESEAPLFAGDFRYPQKWFVESRCDYYGNFTVLVCRVIDGVIRVDSEVYTPAVAPRPSLWQNLAYWLTLKVPPSYEQRVRAARDAAQKRAFELNEQYRQARALETQMEQELLQARGGNPYD